MEEATTMRDVARVEQPIGQRLEVARERLGLTREELGRKIGASVASVQAWEEDERAPRADRLMTLAGVLDVTISWLLEGREDAHMQSHDAATLGGIRAELDRLHAMLAEATVLVEDARTRIDAIEAHDSNRQR